MGNDGDTRKEKKRLPGWVKAADLFLRSCHVGVTGVLFGGVVWAVPFPQLLPWHHLAIATGSCLIVSGVCQCRHWPYQVRGVVALVHVGMLGLVHFRPDLKLPVLTIVLVSGVVGSNMPGYIRHWSLVHGRRVD